LSPTEVGSDLGSFFPDDDDIQPLGYGTDMMQYLNLEPTISQITSPTRSRAHSQSIPLSSQQPTETTNQPPAGASKSSSRRHAASNWKPSFSAAVGDDSPLETKSTRERLGVSAR